MSEKLSKYAAKKARQAETGTVGYLTCEVSGEVKVFAEVKRVPKQTAEERKAQSERDKAKNQAKIAQDHGAVALHIRGFLGRMDDAAKALADAETTIALAKSYAHGEIKGEVMSVVGLYGVAVEKANAAISRARKLLAMLEGAK